MNEQAWEEGVPVVSPEVVVQGATDLISRGDTLMRTQTEYHTAVAVQKPRDLDGVVDAVLEEAKYAGADFYYSWPVKDKKTGRQKIIEGASVGAAMSALRAWGNCALDIDVEDQGTAMVFSPRFVDLETGMSLTRLYKFRPTPAPGSYDAERWQDMQFQNAQSRAIRNVVVAALPRWLIRRMVEVAKDAELKDIDRAGLAASRKNACEFFANRFDVTEAQLVKYVGKKRQSWTSEDVAHLRALGQQLRDGQADPEDIFPKAKGKAKAKPEEKPAKKTNRDITDEFLVKIEGFSSPIKMASWISTDDVAETIAGLPQDHQDIITQAYARQREKLKQEQGEN